jgi:hypothetical protein
LIIRQGFKKLPMNFFNLLFFVCCLLVVTGCPSGPEPPPEDPPKSGEWVDNPIWDISPAFPGIELPEIKPAPVNISIPEDAVLATPQTDFNRSAFFVVAPGDYRGQGKINITASGGTIICPEGDCIFEAFAFGYDVRDWTLSGLTFNGNSIEKQGVKFGDQTNVFGTNIVVDHCDFIHTAGPRIRGNWNTIQYCSFTEKPDISGDVGAPHIDAGTGSESRGNRIIFSYMEGMCDGTGNVWNGGTNGGSTPETVIAYNLSIGDPNYFTNEFGWLVNCTEDGYDTKNGAVTDDLKDRCLFIGNISVGHTATAEGCCTGSAGMGFLFHRRARNWLIQGNISISDAGGIHTKGYNEGKKDNVQNLDIRNNIILYPRSGYQLPNRPNDKDGAGIVVLGRNCQVQDNIVVGAEMENPIITEDAKLSGNRIYGPLSDSDNVVEIETAWGPILVPAPQR